MKDWMMSDGSAIIVRSRRPHVSAQEATAETEHHGSGAQCKPGRNVHAVGGAYQTKAATRNARASVQLVQRGAAFSPEEDLATLEG
jgi:hypothetical protein